MQHYDVVIVGAGHAGAQLAISLRQAGFAGSIAMIGDEPYPPYERPPLSKEFLAQEKPFARILIRPEHFWRDREINWIGHTRVDTVDPANHLVTTDAGEAIGYGKLVWAAGGKARRLALAGADACNAHVVRQRRDVDAIMALLPQTAHVTVIGGGYIGLEAAAVLRKFNKAVTLLEAGTRVLNRVAGEALSRFYEAEHRRHGVDLRLNVAIEGLQTQGERIVSVRLADGVEIATDMVIMGIGIVPEIAPLQAVGAEMDNGVVVDEYCRTSLADIFAIGDCAAHLNFFSGALPIRLESVQNANDQAKTVAACIMGEDRTYRALPWFWSNQYDLKLQTVGLSAGHDEVIVRGDPAQRSFSVLYLRDGRLIAADAVNSVRDYVQAKPLILAGDRIDPVSAGDMTIPLKQAVLACTA